MPNLEKVTRYSLWQWLTIICMIVLIVAILTQRDYSIFQTTAVSTTTALTPPLPHISDRKSPQPAAVPTVGMVDDAQISSLHIPPSANATKITKIDSVGAQKDPLVAVHKVENLVYQRAYDLFEAEVIDFTWAPGNENLLRQMFVQDLGLQRVSLSQISCRTSMCQIVVYTPQSTDADYFTAMFYRALNDFNSGSLKTEAAIARSMENGVTSVYVARQGFTLNFY